MENKEFTDIKAIVLERLKDDNINITNKSFDEVILDKLISDELLNNNSNKSTRHINVYMKFHDIKTECDSLINSLNKLFEKTIPNTHITIHYQGNEYN